MRHPGPHFRPTILGLDRKAAAADADALVAAMIARYPVGARLFLDGTAQAAFAGRGH